jgi:hypothetical protein
MARPFCPLTGKMFGPTQRNCHADASLNFKLSINDAPAFLSGALGSPTALRFKEENKTQERWVNSALQIGMSDLADNARTDGLSHISPFLSRVFGKVRHCPRQNKNRERKPSIFSQIFAF